MPNPPIRTVRLYGEMGAKFGREFKLAVSCPAEACQALGAMIPGFNDYLAKAKDRGIGFGVFVGKRPLSEKELMYPPGAEDIRIAPITFGAKKRGWGQILIGIVLIIVAVVYTYFSGDIEGGATIAMYGVGMIIGGFVQMLIPMPKAPKAQERADDTPSAMFSGPVNTQAQGHPVPLLYGRMFTGSAVVSAGINTEDSSVGTGTGGYVPGGGSVIIRDPSVP